MSIYDYSVTTPDNKALSLSEYKGKVMLIVNTATGCGFTPQYKDLEALYEKYHDQGLEIIDIPCNQFAGQTHEFCSLTYGTTFPQMKKSDVNGENALPLFKYLKSQQAFRGFGDSQMAKFMDDMLAKLDPDYKNNPEIKWNFTKFVVDRKGNVVARFEPTADMKEVSACVESLL